MLELLWAYAFITRCIDGSTTPANTSCSSNAGYMLDQHRRWCANIKSTLGQRFCIFPYNLSFHQSSRYIEPMSSQYWASLADDGQTLYQHRFNVSSFQTSVQIDKNILQPIKYLCIILQTTITYNIIY